MFPTFLIVFNRLFNNVRYYEWVDIVKFICLDVGVINILVEGLVEAANNRTLDRFFF